MQLSRRHSVIVVVLFGAVFGLALAVDDNDDSLVAGEVKEGEQETEAPVLNEEEIEYHKGSICGYCTYCKVGVLTVL